MRGRPEGGDVGGAVEKDVRLAAGAGSADGPDGAPALSPRQSLFVGVTLFSMFFGAGNLILPPLLGVRAGSEALPATLGFFVAGVGLPVLGIVAVALAGTLRELAGRVHPLFARAFVAAVYLAIGPCLAIPRTSSTAFEMLVPLLPGSVSVGTARLAFSVAFFVVAYVLAMRPGRLTRLLGRVTGPALIALIVAVVGAAALSAGEPLAAPQAPYDRGAAVQGFLTGYQTMDLLASLTFGIVIASNVRELGVRDARGLARETSRAGAVAGVLMMAVYGGLCVVGVRLCSSLAGATNGAAVLASSAALHFGVVGTALVAAIFLLACLNVCIGLVSCCGTYFSGELGVPYRACALAFAAFSCVVSNFGLDAILAFSVPLLSALYPVAIVLVVMGMLHRACDAVRPVWAWTVGATAAVGVAGSLRDAFAPALALPIDALPLADVGLGWVVPALAAAAVGVAVGMASGRVPR